MGLLSIFTKPSPPDYESLLSQLATDIAEAKTNLSEIRLRERRLALLINLYGLAFWALWIGLWWVRALPVGLIGSDHNGEFSGKILGTAGVAGGPFFIYALNRLVHLFYSRQRTREENHLRVLLTEQRKHLEEIKKATNYDSTRKLIERYDDPSTPTGRSTPVGAPGSPHTPQKPGSNANTPNATPQIRGPEGTPRAPGHLVGAGGTAGPMGFGTPMTPEKASALHMQMSSIQPVLPTPEKKWYDRIVDSILGDDPSQANQSKFALVCEKCFRHNGLVGSRYEWERMQWICPRCKHLNPPPLSRLPPSLSDPLTPSKPPQQPQATLTPSLVQRSAAGSPSSRSRRGIGAKETPGASKLGRQVISADDSESEGEDDEEDDGVGEEEMEVDQQ